MTSLTLRLPDETASKLDLLARKLDLSPDVIAAQVIEDFVASEEWRVREITAGLSEAEAGEFGTAAEIEAVLAKYSTGAA